MPSELVYMWFLLVAGAVTNVKLNLSIFHETIVAVGKQHLKPLARKIVDVLVVRKLRATSVSQVSRPGH